MKKKKGVKYFEQELKSMTAHLRSYLKNNEQEDLHQFRVKIKKLEAFLILSDGATHHSDLAKQFKPIKKIFKHAGTLRDAYLNLEFIKLFQPDNTKDEDILIKNATAEFKSNGDKYLQKIKEVRRTLKKEIKSLKDASVNRFYDSQLRQIAKMLTSHHFSKQLHECRKHIKILLYNNKLAHESLIVRLNEDYLEQLQQVIGNWHDQSLSITRLRLDRASEYRLISTMNEGLTRLKEEIISLTQDFYDRAIII